MKTTLLLHSFSIDNSFLLSISLEDLPEYEYGSMSEAYVSISKTRIDNGTQSLRIKPKPIVPERDSSLYDCFTTTNARPLVPAVSVPNLSTLRCNSNSSSNEADEETSLSSMNSNQITNSNEENGIGIYMTPSLSLSTSNMSTFKTNTIGNTLPSKPSEVKRRSNNRKQHYAATNITTKTIENESPAPPPPPPPPLPANFDAKPKIEPVVVSKPTPKVEPVVANEFQKQIEQAKNRLKKVDVEIPIHTQTSPLKQAPSKSFVFFRFSFSNSIFILVRPTNYRPLEMKNIIIEEITPPHGFPPPPSPSTLRRTVTVVPSITDPRLDSNFSSVIAQRAAAAKARRSENSTPFEYNINKLQPSTTFFNNCITTNGVEFNSKSMFRYHRVHKLVFSAIYHHRY